MRKNPYITAVGYIALALLGLGLLLMAIDGWDSQPSDLHSDTVDGAVPAAFGAIVGIVWFLLKALTYRTRNRQHL